MKVSAQYAQEHLAELLELAECGQAIDIDRDDKPSAKIIIMPTPESAERPKGKRILGAGIGELTIPTDEEWRVMKEEDARLMNDAPLMMSGEI